MANVTITGLAPASALTGTEVLAIDQSGSTVKTTVQDVANLASGLGSLEINADGSIGNVQIPYEIKAIIPSTYTGGDADFPILLTPTISLYGQYNGPFTATTIDFPTLIVTNQFTISSSSSVKDVSAPLLTSAVSLTITSNSALESLDFPNLISIGNLNLSNNNSSIPLSLNFPALINCSVNLQSNSGVTSMNSTNFPVLSVASFNISDGNLVAVSLPSITRVENYQFNQSANLTTVNFPNTVTIATSYIGSFYSGFPNLVSVSVGTAGTLKFAPNNMYITFEGCALNEASVDGLLTAFASLDGTNGTTASIDGNIALTGGCAAPSATGLSARTVLLNRGWSVSVNS